MKPSGTLHRKTALARRKPLRRTAIKRRHTPTGPTRTVVALVEERAAHSCERCDAMVGDIRGVDHHIHHRRPRQAGGSRKPDTNAPQNLVLLCPPCHHWVETHRAAARSTGWLVPGWADPAVTPLFYKRQRYALLTPDGTLTRAEVPR